MLPANLTLRKMRRKKGEERTGTSKTLHFRSKKRGKALAERRVLFVGEIVN